MELPGRLIVGGIAAVAAGGALHAYRERSGRDLPAPEWVDWALMGAGAASTLSGAAMLGRQWMVDGRAGSLDDVLVGDRELGYRRLGDVLKDETIRIDIAGGGPASKRAMTLHVDSEARHWLKDTSPRRLESAIRAALSEVDTYGARAELQGISLSFSFQGEAANKLEDIWRGFAADGLTAADSRVISRMARRYFARARSQTSLAEHNWSTQRIVLGSEVSYGLVQAIRGVQQTSQQVESNLKTAWVLAHELQHAVTPSTISVAHPWKWVEEARADLIGLRLSIDTARRMGIKVNTTDVDEVAEYVGYPEYRDALRLLGKLAGMSPDTPAGAGAISAFLQSRDEEHVLRDLASRIARAHNLNRDTVWYHVRQVNGDTDVVGRMMERFGLSLA